MKRIVSLVLVAALCAAMISGCGAPKAETSPAPPDPGASAAAPADAAAKTWEEQGLETPLADVRVRQALAHAIDMETIVATIFKGKAEAAKSMTSPGDWLTDGLNDYAYDVEKAKSLLKEAGWPADYTLDVVYYYADQQTVDLMTVIGQYWSEAGVKSAFRKLEGDLNSQLWVTPEDKVKGPSAVKWDLAYAAVAALTEHEFYERFMSTAPNNSSLPKQEGLDELIAAASATADTETQKKAFHEIQKVMNENMYQLPLYHQVAFIYNSDKLDMKGAAVGNDQYSYEKNILDWNISRDDKTLYTNTGPLEFFETPVVNPGLYIYQELLFDRLINADENLNPTDGMLAESYKLSDDQKQLEFVMRGDAKWHDGQPVTAEDVKFTIELYLKAPGTNAIVGSTLSAIKGAEAYKAGTADSIEGIVIDGNKITLEFEKIAPNALMIFAQWPVLPKHKLENVDPNTLQQDAFWQNPVGSGPFTVGDVKLGSYSTLKRWDGYYKKGTGNIETIYMFASGDNDANLIKNAEGGKIDYAWSKSTDDAESMEKIANIKVTPAKIRYTRLFYINQFPHDANIK